MINFMTLYPEWIIRQCQITENTTKKTPIIKMCQLSYNVLFWNETIILKHRMTPYVFRGYKIVIDDNIDIGVCNIITE